MNSIVVYMDVDGVVRDLVGAIDRLYRERFPGHNPVLSTSYDLDTRYPLWGQATYDIVFREQMVRLFNYDAAPIDGAVDAVKHIVAQEEIEVKFLSKQAGGAIAATNEWLDRYGFDAGIERLFVPSEITKAEFLMGLDEIRSAVMIDDSGTEVEAVAEYLAGEVTPILVAQVWNTVFRETWDGYVIDQLDKSIEDIIYAVSSDGSEDDGDDVPSDLG